MVKKYTKMKKEKKIMAMANCIYKGMPIVRAEDGTVLYKNISYAQVLNYILYNDDCLEELVRNFPHVVENYGSQALRFELPYEKYARITELLRTTNLELAIDFSRFLDQREFLFQEIAREGIEQNINISPIIGALYQRYPKLYKAFMDKQRRSPSPEGMVAIMNFFTEHLSRVPAKDVRKERLEFAKWLDILEIYLKDRPQSVNFLKTTYLTLKEKKEGGAAYLLKELLDEYAPQLFTPKSLAENVFIL